VINATCLTFIFQDELEQQLCLFSRDEVLTWLHVNKQPALIDITFRNRVEENTAVVVERARHMACTVERQQHINPPAPGVQTMMISPLQSAAQLLSQATSPLNLTKMTEMYQPWF
jgi:transformation/transcription domain-associated protein